MRIKHNPKFVAPKVENGIPLPKPYHPKRSPRAPSPWIKYLQSLKPGQSFVIPYHLLGAVKKHSYRLNLNITAATIDLVDAIGHHKCRVWIVDKKL